MRYRTDTYTIEAPTVPKQIDKGTACPLGQGLEVLCGVRLIIKIEESGLTTIKLRLWRPYQLQLKEGVVHRLSGTKWV